MRISTRTAAERRERASGFTLVEILVVLAIIAVVSSIAVLGLAGASAPSAQSEAQRLAASLQVASEETLVADRVVAFDWDAEGYSFSVWNSSGWRAHESVALGERHKLPADMSLAVSSEELPFPIDENASLSVTLSAASETWSVQFDGLNATVTPGR